MSEPQPWLDPIRTAAAAIAADPPPLTEWEAGDEDDGEVIDSDVEKLLVELGWPTRTKTFTVPVTVLGSNPRRVRWTESTPRYFPISWLTPLVEHVARYVQARDADQNPDVPDRLRLRKLPQSADFNAVRDIIDGAWEHAWDELACSVAVMCPDEAMGMDFLRYNFAVMLWEGFYNSGLPEHLKEARRGETFQQRMKREEDDLIPGLRDLPSPKWRAWFLDTWTDFVAIHDTLAQCGVEVEGRLSSDLHFAGYALDMDVTRMTIEELVTRIEVKHRFLASAFRAARDGTDEVGFSSCRTSNRPAGYAAIMETVGRLRAENMQWKEIREEVLKTHQYRTDSEDALRKSYGRWQKSRRPAG